MENPTLDALLILIAELHKSGAIDTANLTSMGRRLDLADLEDIGDRVRFIPLSNAVDDPKRIRSHMHLVDGGNKPD
ncbi:hypothetical protein [Allopontixanthobacter sediminis]|uniref:Uncharacterized protein n=1 Tax=Allopontixanthobacter sediminis TaxID=1689985 RepID=A0A845B0N6_9SPHN|nr:hypothetical protein [Allopontixanthobacter sediminis]MXP42987.1 hypothetical protein [Allopontixanthobacter sediminis]